MVDAIHKRSIRSFVRRTGRLTPSQNRALNELWPRYGIDQLDTQQDFEQAFAGRCEKILEIGFGNGESLIDLATARPDAGILGIEVHEPGIGHCLLQIEKAEVENLRIVSGDATDILRDSIPAGSLAEINLYFPDPWPKKRHHKRRIVQSEFVDIVSDKLRRDGLFRIATDWQNYAEHIDEVLAKSERLTLLESSLHDGTPPDYRSVTKFERRGVRKGHQIRDWSFCRKSC